MKRPSAIRLCENWAWGTIDCLWISFDFSDPKQDLNQNTGVGVLTTAIHLCGRI